MARRAHQSTPLTEAHDEYRGFRNWPKSAIVVLRALGHGEAATTQQIEWASAALGAPISYGMARQGINFLEGRRSGMTNAPTRAEAFCIYVGQQGPSSAYRLTAEGMKRAASSFRIYPASTEAPADPSTSAPPDPLTPLWRVLHDHGETLVIAADRQAALALFEQETGEEAHRAEPVDTTAPLVLGWTATEGKKKAPG